MPENPAFALTLERIQNYEFKTQFDWEHLPPLLVDEAEPLGQRKGPNPSRLLAAAVGDCLSASLLFCLQKAKLDVKHVKTKVKGELVRNDKGRLRIGKIGVSIMVELADGQYDRINRCLDLFEDYCVVTASVRKGIPVSVVVTDPRGIELYHDDGETR
ncbi:MAG: OsmC family protein [candidate division KSB1 bacterium]|nr:OsmC family protein [candidate division KSB1 bacterium]MDZ7366701.1 OsmC family protein [candidate division KSB1 bacterium]MDZ7404714.1 OsmC family protein [candidate division KSB1 bacterium]